MKLFLLNCDINWPNFIDRDCVYFPSFQYNVFLVLCFRHLISHEIWTSKIVKLDFLENEKSFSSETKTFSLIWQVFLFRIKNQTTKNTVIQQRIQKLGTKSKPLLGVILCSAKFTLSNPIHAPPAQCILGSCIRIKN